MSTAAPGPHGGSFSGRVGWGDRPALVVVDLCRAYTDPGGPFALPGAATVVRAVDLLVDRARVAGHPVLWTRVRYRADLADAGWFVHKVPALAAFADGAEGDWGACTLAAREGERVLDKQQASAFAGTDLAEALRAMAVDTVVVCGVSTSGCVRATATDAMAAGFRPVVVAEACGDRTEELQAANLADLDAKYADVVTLEDALAHWS